LLRCFTIHRKNAFGKGLCSSPAGGAENFDQYLPERYNMQTELTVDVKADGANTFAFDLKSM